MKNYKIISALTILVVSAVFIYLTFTTQNSTYPIIFFILLFIYFGVTNYMSKKRKNS
jgi:uncharacterized RDD family membrane protein YckC